MKKVNALEFAMKEFNGLCDKVFNGGASIQYDSGDWFWCMSDEVGEDDINPKLESELGIKIDNIYADFTNYIVVIACK